MPTSQLEAQSKPFAVCDPSNMTPVDTAFAIVRPPGQMPTVGNKASAFKIEGVAARVAQKEYNKKKVVVFDWDGGAYWRWDRGRMCFMMMTRCCIFEHLGKLLPGLWVSGHVGKGRGKEYNIQFPFIARRWRVGPKTEINGSHHKIKGFDSDSD